MMKVLSDEGREVLSTSREIPIPCARLVISAIFPRHKSQTFSATSNLFSLSKSTQGQPRPPPRIPNSGVLPALLGV